MTNSMIRLATCAGIWLFAVALFAGPPEPGKSTKAAKEALSQFNSLIGGWRGTAQPRRGSATGSWRESAEWVWDFSQPEPAIRYVVTDGKLLKSVRITFDDKNRLFHATAELADGAKRDYSGKF